MNVSFETEAWHAVAPKPSGKVLALSPEQIEAHNKAFDEYMAQAYQPHDRVEDKDTLEMAEFVFAITGKLFVRVVKQGYPSQASTPDEDGVQYLVVNEPDFLELFEITGEVLDEVGLH